MKHSNATSQLTTSTICQTNRLWLQTSFAFVWYSRLAWESNDYWWFWFHLLKNNSKKSKKKFKFYWLYVCHLENSIKQENRISLITSLHLYFEIEYWISQRQHSTPVTRHTAIVDWRAFAYFGLNGSTFHANL